MNGLIKKLKNEVDKIVKNYKSDFEIDKSFILENSDKKLNFIYQIRANGTQLYSMENIENHLLHDKIKYLFGYSTRLKIKTDQLQCIETSFKEHIEHFYYISNNEVKKINRERACLIYRDYLRNLQLKRAV